MRKLSLTIISALLMLFTEAQESPHGENFAISCTDCHTTAGWKFSSSNSIFNHNATRFKLNGQHGYIRCTDCHKTLVFSEAKTNCFECHTDMHKNTVSQNCNECHNSNTWLVENITEIHYRGRFPLLGPHNTAECIDCHTSVSQLEFEPMGVECIDCHRKDYMSATNPNHVQSNISIHCTDCHRIEAFEWSASGINHDFFPLTSGHQIENCASCHTNGIFEPLSADCYSCHQNDYNSALNPKHNITGFPTNCTECHTTDPGWNPADFKIHDAMYFPVYSGRHSGEWNKCSDCHTQTDNYSVFSCTDCHEHNNTDMGKKHDKVRDYVYNSINCLDCHPVGRAEDD